MRWDQISCNFVIFVFSFFEIVKIVKQKLTSGTQSLFRIFQFYSFSGSRIAFWPENRDPDLLKHAISQNIMHFGDFCILIFQNFENCNKNLKFDTQSFDRIFQFTLFFGPRIDFWPENRVPEWIKHAISQNIMDFGDFCIHCFQSFEIC